MLKITISDRKKYFPKMCLSASGPLRALVGLRKRPLETCNVDCATPGGRLRGVRWSRSTPQYFWKIFSRSEIMIFIIFHDFHLFWRHFDHFATLGSPSHGQWRSLSIVLTRAYLTNEARIGRKITGKSSSFDLVWVLWELEQARDHSEPIPRRPLDFPKNYLFSKIYVNRPCIPSSFVFEHM